jgi:sigma-B regulation protein RsbU (phosphoserine phosphatase)
MRVLPRFTRPTIKSARRLWRRFTSHLTVRRVIYTLEVVIFGAVFVLVYSGSRARFVDGYGKRADLLAALLLIGVFTLFHFLNRRYITPRIERYFQPVPYSERKILLDLGHGSRTVSSIDQLYERLAQSIREALEAGNVSIFVRDEISGDYELRVRAAIDKQITDDPNDRTTLKSSAFVVRRLAGLSTPLTIEAGELQTWANALNTLPASLREGRAAEREVIRKIGARLLVQVRLKEELVGILSLGARRAEFQYTQADRELLMSIAAQLALVIDNARLTERIVAQERLRRELALAAEVQQRLLPSHMPGGRAIEVAGFCEPARGVGGDYYDFINFDEDQLGVAIADVAGKGMPAALLMSTVQATLRSLTARNGLPPPPTPQLDQMVGKLNRLIFNSTNGSHYVTFFYASFDQTTRMLTYVNAGHNPPLFLQAGSTLEFRTLTAGGLVAGAFEHANYDQESVQMNSDDLLFMYTDGLTEALSRDGEEFGEDRLKETLTASALLSVDTIRDAVVKRVKEWCTGAALYDDLTFVVMKVK